MTDREMLADPGLLRSSAVLRGLLARIRGVASGRPWRIMEVCGGQTYTLSRYRIEELLPPGVEMVHGPGCPVCVTPSATVDDAIALALRPEVILCSFGDMLRVPGSSGSLLRARASGADVRILYSPLDALSIARSNPEREVVFFAIGFETTAPAYALMVRKAVEAGIGNLSLLTSLFTVPAAVRAIKSDPSCRVDALLAAGHVCAVTGTAPYADLAAEFGMPVVVTGFEPADMLLGILRSLTMLEQGRAELANEYRRVVSPEGNRAAMLAVDRVFEPCEASWRGIGTLGASGMRLRPESGAFDARRRFGLGGSGGCGSDDAGGCIAGRIMRGLARPSDCPCFGRGCSPEAPKGAPMVSAEGACAAYYKYNR